MAETTLKDEVSQGFSYVGSIAKGKKKCEKIEDDVDKQRCLQKIKDAARK